MASLRKVNHLPLPNRDEGLLPSSYELIFDMTTTEIIRRHRRGLWILALAGLLGLNGPFLYFAIARPEVLASALANPVSLVFIVEAFVLMAFAVGAIWILGLQRPGWMFFLVTSLAGGLAFSVPLFLLLHARDEKKRRRMQSTTDSSLPHW